MSQQSDVIVEQLNISKVNKPSYRIPALVLVALFIPIFLIPTHSDFTWHRDYALLLKAEGGWEKLPHFFYHALVILTSALIPNLSSKLYGSIPVFVAYVLLGLLVYRLIRTQFEATQQTNSEAISIRVTVLVLTLAPIYLLGYSLSYFSATIYHNPTYVIMKLFIIPISYYALQVIAPPVDSSLRLRTILLSAILVIVSALAKPNYVLVLLPSISLFVAYRWVKQERVDLILFIFGILLPTLSILGVQFLSTSNMPGHEGMGIGLFTVFKAWGSLWEVPFLLILSIAFPLAVYVLFHAQAKRDTYLNLSWLTFIFGVLFAYVFYEAGGRMSAGGYVFGTHAALFGLMFATVLFLIRHYPVVFRVGRFSDLSRLDWRVRVVVILLGFHIISALAQYFIFAFENVGSLIASIL